MNQNLQVELNSLKVSLQPAQRVFVAFSGGLDSTVLLHLLAGDSEIRPRLQAVHVNHQLQPQSADWADHCRTFCQLLDVPYHESSIIVTSKARQGMESMARQKRYQALFSFLGEGELLLTAHHQRDQAETLLLNLARGAGVKGLSAMPERKQLRLADGKTLFHLRPFLHTDYASLYDYAIAHSLQWVDDPSNACTDYSRNYVRHQLLPGFKQVWPGVEKQLSRTASYMSEAQILLNRMAESELREHKAGEICIDLERFSHLDWVALKNVLRYWSEHYAGIRFGQGVLDWLFEYLFKLKRSHASMKLRHGELILFHKKIYYLADIARKYEVSFMDLTESLFENKNSRCACDSYELTVPKSWLKHNQTRLQIRGLNADDPVNRVKLKKWFQSRKVPVWQRRYWPLLALEGKMVALWGVKQSLQPDAFPLSEYSWSDSQERVTLRVTEETIYRLSTQYSEC